MPRARPRPSANPRASPSARASWLGLGLGLFLPHRRPFLLHFCRAFYSHERPTKRGKARSRARQSLRLG